MGRKRKSSVDKSEMKKIYMIEKEEKEYVLVVSLLLVSFSSKSFLFLFIIYFSNYFLTYVLLIFLTFVYLQNLREKRRKKNTSLCKPSLFFSFSSSSFLFSLYYLFFYLFFHLRQSYFFNIYLSAKTNLFFFSFFSIFF